MVNTLLTVISLYCLQCIMLQYTVYPVLSYARVFNGWCTLLFQLNYLLLSLESATEQIPNELQMPVIVISLRDGMHHNTNRYCLFCFRVYFLHIQPTSHHIPITHVLHPCSQSPFCPSTPEHNKREVNPTLSWSVAEQLHYVFIKACF